MSNGFQPDGNRLLTHGTLWTRICPVKLRCEMPLVHGNPKVRPASTIDIWAFWLAQIHDLHHFVPYPVECESVIILGMIKKVHVVAKLMLVSDQ